MCNALGVRHTDCTCIASSKACAGTRTWKLKTHRHPGHGTATTIQHLRGDHLTKDLPNDRSLPATTNARDLRRSQRRIRSPTGLEQEEPSGNVQPQLRNRWSGRQGRQLVQTRLQIPKQLNRSIPITLLLRLLNFAQGITGLSDRFLLLCPNWRDIGQSQLDARDQCIQTQYLQRSGLRGEQAHIRRIQELRLRLDSARGQRHHQLQFDDLLLARRQCKRP